MTLTGQANLHAHATICEMREVLLIIARHDIHKDTNKQDTAHAQKYEYNSSTLHTIMHEYSLLPDKSSVIFLS